jgi:UDP-N-acetylmuramate dehydrogenase
MLWDPESPDRRSCGSFFLNPMLSVEQFAQVCASAEPSSIPHWPTTDGRVKVSAAWLIERVGFSRSQRFGPVGISSRHALALVCHDGARAEDLVRLARRIRARVRERFGVRLLPEPSFWGFERLEDGLPG